MIRKILALALSALLSACGTFVNTVSGPERVFPASPPSQLNCANRDGISSAYCDKLNAKYTTALNGDSNYSDLYAFVDWGFEYQKLKCQVYLTSVLQMDKYNGSAGDLATSLGAVGTGVMAIINPDALATKVIGATTGAIAATDSVYQNDFLFNNEDKAQLEATVLQHLTDYKATLLSEMPANPTFPMVYNALYASYDECTWQHIQNLIQAALKAQQTGKVLPPETNFLPSQGVVASNLIRAQERARVALAKWSQQAALEAEMIKLGIDLPDKEKRLIAEDCKNVRAWISASTTKAESVEELADDFDKGLPPLGP